jgi:hypothetical protein
MQEQSSIPEFYTGSPVDSADLMFRGEFISELWEKLKTHHVLLIAPRRTGKTSVMDYLRDYPAADFSVVYQNVQDLSHPAEFFLTILDTFQDKHPDLIRQLAKGGWKLVTQALDKISEIGVGTFKVRLRESDPNWKQNWRLHGEQFLHYLRKHNLRILLIVDELPDMVLNLKKENPDLLREFLAWFRAQRMAPHPRKDPVRWLLGGSVNLFGTLDAIGMVDLINDLENVPLPILKSVQVQEFVRLMLSKRQVAFTMQVPERLCAHLGRPIPLFMQMATQELYRSWKHQPRELTTADVDVIFDHLATSTAAQDKLQHYYSRLAKYYEEPRLTAAHALLSKLSLSKSGLTRNVLGADFARILLEAGQNLPPHDRKRHFNQLLRDLENDFYVAEIRANRFDFASGLMKIWWRKYYA